MDPQDQFDSDFRLYHEIQAVRSVSGVRFSHRAHEEYPSPLEVASPQEDHFDFLQMVSLAIQISLESQEGKKFEIRTTFHNTISGTIGEGGNAFVKPVGLVTGTSRGRIVAAKIRHYHQHQGYNLNHENWRLWMQESIAEPLILRHDKTLNHENITNLLGLNLVPVTNGSDALWPMFLYGNSELGSLAKYQSNNPPLSLDQKIEILLGIFSALQTLHEVGVVHGDVKTENVLLFPGRKNLVPKLSDFGGSRFIISDSRRFLGTFL